MTKKGTHDEGSHRGRSLGVGVLETGDGREDLGDGDEDVRGGLGPHADPDRRVALARELSAGTLLVDRVLHDRSADHRTSARREPERNLLDWRETDSVPREEGVDEKVEDGNEDDETQWVKVGDHVVREVVQSHRRRLGAGEELPVSVVGRYARRTYVRLLLI